MAQLAPTTLQYGQLMALINEFLIDYKKGIFKNSDKVIEKIKELMTQFNDIGGQPLLDFESFELGEPPDSEKMNRIWRMVENDVNLLQSQIEVLKAAALFLFNFMTTEIKLAKNQNANASNKLKTLQLYSTAQDANIIQFGDYFTNLDLVDLSLTPNSMKVSHLGPGVVSLGRTNLSFVENDQLEIKVLPTSNGFMGNNQEINDPSTAIKSPLNDNEYIYAFRAGTSGRHSDLKEIFDGIPNTWFEYEANQITTADRLKAKDLNFVYRNLTDLSTSSTSSNAADTSTANSLETQGLVDWAVGPSQGVLKLDLEFDLKAPKVINTIAYLPFGLENNKNAPVKVKLVQTSPNGTDWSSVTPENLWIAMDANVQTARVADNVMIGSAIYAFDERAVRYIRISIEQSQSIESNIGHVYYETSKRVITTHEEQPAPNGNGTIIVDKETIVGGDRTLGPIPPISTPDKYYSQNGLIAGNLVQKTEYFKGKRWAIGIRDIVIQESKYVESSTLITKLFRVSGVVDRVSLEADIFVPSNFSAEPGIMWVKFYVSPNDGLNWYPIARVQDDYLGIPEIIAFNDPLPSEFRETGVSYISTNSVVNSLRVKIELGRPQDLVSSSPILNSYKLKVVKR